jgi:hypothetical protein
VPWNLTLKGGLIDGQDQSAVITFICDTAAVSGEAFLSTGYEITGTVNGQWTMDSGHPELRLFFLLIIL